MSMTDAPDGAFIATSARVNPGGLVLAVVDDGINNYGSLIFEFMGARIKNGSVVPEDENEEEIMILVPRDLVPYILECIKTSMEWEPT